MYIHFTKGICSCILKSTILTGNIKFMVKVFQSLQQIDYLTYQNSLLLSNRIYDYHCVYCFLSFLTLYNTMIFSNTVKFTCLQGTKIYYSQSQPELPGIFSKHLSTVTFNIFLFVVCFILIEAVVCFILIEAIVCFILIEAVLNDYLALSSDLFHNTKGIFTCQIQVIHILSNNEYICII